MTNESPFSCVLDAIEPSKRQQHLDNARQLFGSLREVRELPDGFAFSFAGGSESLLKAAEFISLERLCCPFFGFTLEVEPEGGPLWLKLTGRKGVKEFIQAEISEFTGAKVFNVNRS